MSGVVKPWERKDLLRLRPHWQEIAFDLINSQTPLPDGSINVSIGDICEAYDMTKEECRRLLNTPEFKRVLKDTQRRVAAMGENSAIMLRAQALSVPLMEQVAMAALEPSVDIKDKISALKVISNIGNLDPQTNGTNKQAKDGGGGNAAAVSTVNFILPSGIPGIEHVQPKVISGEVVEETERVIE